MTVLIVGVLDREGSTNIHIRNAFKSIGCEVEDFNYRSIAHSVGGQTMNEILLAKAESRSYDLLFLCKANGVEPQTIRKCNKYCKSWLWFMDCLKQANDNRSNELAAACNFVSTGSSDVLGLFKEVNPNSFHMIDGYDENIYYPGELVEQTYPISFIGNWSNRRQEILYSLANKCGPIFIWGSNWTSGLSAFFIHGMADEKRFADICRQSKVCLNIQTHDGQTGFSNRVVRVFGSGGFLVSDYAKDYSTWMKNGEQMIWGNIDEMVEAINKTSPADRLVIAKNGLEFAKNNCTWKHFTQKVVQHINEGN